MGVVVDSQHDAIRPMSTLPPNLLAAAVVDLGPRRPRPRCCPLLAASSANVVVVAVVVVLEVVAIMVIVVLFFFFFFCLCTPVTLLVL